MFNLCPKYHFNLILEIIYIEVIILTEKRRQRRQLKDLDVLAVRKRVLDYIQRRRGMAEPNPQDHDLENSTEDHTGSWIDTEGIRQPPNCRFVGLDGTVQPTPMNEATSPHAPPLPPKPIAENNV